MDREIEQLVKMFIICNHNKPQQPSEPLKPHSTPLRPWQRNGVDIFVLHGKNYMITADFYSGWFEFDLLYNLLSIFVITK